MIFIASLVLLLIIKLLFPKGKSIHNFYSLQCIKNEENLCIIFAITPFITPVHMSGI